MSSSAPLSAEAIAWFRQACPDEAPERVSVWSFVDVHRKRPITPVVLHQLKRALEWGMSPNLPEPQPADSPTWVPLTWAMVHNERALHDLLIAHGVDWGQRNDHSGTPLETVIGYRRWAMWDTWWAHGYGQSAQAVEDWAVAAVENFQPAIEAFLRRGWAVDTAFPEHPRVDILSPEHGGRPGQTALYNARGAQQAQAWLDRGAQLGDPADPGHTAWLERWADEKLCAWWSARALERELNEGLVGHPPLSSLTRRPRL